MVILQLLASCFGCRREICQKAFLVHFYIFLVPACQERGAPWEGRLIWCVIFSSCRKKALGLLVKLERWYEANLLVFYELFLLKHLMKILTKWQHSEDQKQPWLWQFWQSQTILMLWTLSRKIRQGHFPHGVWLCQYRLYRSEDGSWESHQETTV